MKEVVPDIVFPKAKTAIFIDPCTHHGCTGLNKKTPKEFQALVKKHLGKAVRVDKGLMAAGWTSLHFWRCQMKGIDFLATVQGITDMRRGRGEF